jgi:glycosyltransferase involved in cell wall biosynthesis
MRILYCNKYNFPFSGTEAYLFSAMELMRARGHEVALFSMADERGAATPYDEFFVPHVDFKNGEPGPIHKARLAAHAVYSHDARVRLRKMLTAFRPDVAHVRNIYHHLSPSILWELKAQNVPVLYHLNDFKLLCPSYNMVAQNHACEHCHGGQFWRVLTEGCYPAPLGSRVVLAAEAYFHKWLQTYQRCVDLFLAPSRFVKDKLVDNGWDERKIEVLPHFQRVPEESPPDPAWDAPILYFGRLSPEKGLTELLRAMKRLPRVRLQVAGDGPQRQELQRLATDLSLTNVEFSGHVGGTALERLIDSSRFTVLPSRAYETLGKTILESHARGRAVVASDLGSRRELIEEGTTGLLYRPGDIAQLAGAISFLYDRPQLALQMGATGRELARERYNPESHYTALSFLYQQLACPPPAPDQGRAAGKPPLRVAFIGGRGVASKYSGIEAYYEEVGRHLAAKGHEITIYCRAYFTPPLEEYHQLRIVRLPTIRTKHLETLLHTLLSTIHVLFSRCEIVHYHALGPALFSFLPRLFGKKTIVTVQGLDWQRKKWGKIASAVLRLGERAAVRLPNQTMVVSQTLQRHFQELHGQSTTYIPNGAVLRERRPPTKLQDWKLAPDNYILFLGRFSPEKNCHLLIRAYQQIDTPVKLVLAGGSSYSNEYENQLRRQASDRIVLLDYVSGDDLEELITHAMLFVLPSDLEGLSLALLDAMGAGVCVLTSDIPENRELVDNAGFTFQRGNVHDLERMLRLLISEPEVRQCAARNGQEHVRQHYLWPTIAEEIEQSYLELTGRQTSFGVPPEKVTGDDRTKNRVA